MKAVIHPEQSDYEWQVKGIQDWKIQTNGKTEVVMLKVSWIGGDQQWISMDNARLHDPFLIIRYALRNNLMKHPAWKWTKHYMDSDDTLNHMIHAYKASRFLKNIKFGIEVPQSTSHAMSMDETDE